MKQISPLLALAGAFATIPLPASARDFDLTLYRDGETFLKPSLEFQTAYLVQDGAWGGSSDEILGATVHASCPGTGAAMAASAPPSGSARTRPSR